MSETRGVPPPQAAPKKASPVRIIVMLALGGPVLAVGGCALFLSSISFSESGHGGNDAMSGLGAIVFCAGCLAFIVGIVWAIARAIDRRFDAAKAAKEAEAGGGPPPQA